MPLRDVDAANPADMAARLRTALDFANAGEWTWDAASDMVVLSPTAAQIFGVPASRDFTWSQMQSELLHPDDAPAAAAAVQRAIAEQGQYEVEYRVRRAGGSEGWILAHGRATYDPRGEVRGMVGLVQDVTRRREEQRALAEEARALEILNRTGSLIASELDLEKMVQAVTDAGVEITGAQFGAFFYNVVGATGEQYMLYTISGAPREAFSRFPMPRNTPIFGPTFSGSGVVRSGNILADERYGKLSPHHGMPKGHLPVCSYLAVPVLSRSGEVIGGLFFGHKDPDVFDARDERIIVGVSAQAAIGIDNARLYQRAQRELAERQKAEETLRALSEALELRVSDRTAALEAANAQLQREIEDRRRAEEALRHAQKLEAIGHLTGGVAHDFNNLLTIVIGNLDGLQRRLGAEVDTRTRRAVDAALDGARRAASLTQRLLAFARRQPLDPKPLDANKLVQGMSDLLSRTLGERVEIETVLSAGLWPVEADAGQLESAILNLALNARDAMPEGGKLTVETTNVAVDDTYSRANAIAAGQYVVICVSDTGGGIPPQLLEKVFEPFFTTKPVGQGTGLGLSQVYGFVKQSGGNVKIYSEPGEGTTIKVYLPRYFGNLDPVVTISEAVLRAESQETVLVVEDEPGVRELSVSMFEDLGYQVLQAADGYAALDILAKRQRVDLLFTDVGLPKMNGRQLAEEARKRRPTLKVLFTTGYARNAIVHHGRLDPGVDLLVKPFTYEDLADKVRTILDRTSGD